MFQYPKEHWSIHQPKKKGVQHQERDIHRNNSNQRSSQKDHCISGGKAEINTSGGRICQQHKHQVCIKFVLYGGVGRRKVLLKMSHTKFFLDFGSPLVGEMVSVWKKLLRSDKTKRKLFLLNAKHLWRKTILLNTISVSLHRSSIMVWDVGWLFLYICHCDIIA